MFLQNSYTEIYNPHGTYTKYSQLKKTTTGTASCKDVSDWLWCVASLFTGGHDCSGQYAYAVHSGNTRYHGLLKIVTG